MALQPQRAKTDWSGCCQMAVQGVLWLAKRLSLNLNFSFLNWISLLFIQVATQFSSRGWVDPVPDPVLPEKFLGYSRESNPGPLGWQSDVLTTIPNRRSSQTPFRPPRNPHRVPRFLTRDPNGGKRATSCLRHWEVSDICYYRFNLIYK